jgi:hypothetical protein
VTTRRTAAALLFASIGAALFLARLTLPDSGEARAPALDAGARAAADSPPAADLAPGEPEAAPPAAEAATSPAPPGPGGKAAPGGAAPDDAPAGPVPADVARHVARAISAASKGRASAAEDAFVKAVREEAAPGRGGPDPDPDAPPPPGTGLLGEYWKLLDQELLDFPRIAGLAPTISRLDPFVNFRNGGDFRFPWLARNFAARWRGFVYAAEDGSYVFTLGADDGGWLLIDGVQVAAVPGLHPYLERPAEVFLFKGFHAIEMRMFQNEGDVGAVLAWKPPDGEPGIVPTEVLYPPNALSTAQAPRITAVTPPRAHYGESVEIDGTGFPDQGVPTIATFDGISMNAESLGGGRIQATIPPGVDRGDIVVGDPSAPSQGFPYEVGDLFGLLGEYAATTEEIHTLAEAPPPGATGAFKRVDDQIAFRSAQAFALPFPSRRFVARYTGQLYCPNDGVYRFRLTSDDGSRLYVDGAVVADDDDLHPMRAVEGETQLGQGFHRVELDFFQNDGPCGLVLEWGPPGAGDYAVLPRRDLYPPPGLSLRDPPQVDGIDPQAAQPGDAVEIRGRGFAGDGVHDRVTFFDGQQASIDGASATRLVVRVPPRAQSGPIVVQSGELAADPPLDFTVLGRGLSAAYYQFDGPLSTMPSVDGRAPTLTRVDPRIAFGEDLSFHLPFEPDHFAALYTGTLAAPDDGHYVFGLGSDDGSRLFIDGQKLIDNDGLHGYTWKQGETDLAAGSHAIRVEFFENEGVAALRLGWLAPGRGWEVVPQAVLFPDQ